MGRRLVTTDGLHRELVADFDAIRAELGIVPEFAPAIEEAAAAAAARGPRPAKRADRTSIPFVTIDPPGSLDLDQALHIAADGSGLVVSYAIADVGAFVDRGDAVEQEAWHRGVTAYAPDRRALLYPAGLSEGAASLLPDVDRPSVLFTATLDAAGEVSAFAVERAVVRSRRRMSYAEGQREGMPLLEELGRRRLELAMRRGAVELDLPAQEVVPDGREPCGFRLQFEHRLPIEDWNAQVSLLVGMASAQLMIDRGAGILRVMPPPDPAKLAAARVAAGLLGFDWPADALLAEVAREARDHPEVLALMRRAMGHAGYLAFHGPPPPGHEHAGLQAAYAHVTAPLRRLADRYALDLLVELAAGASPTDPEMATLDRLPQVMTAAESRAGRLEHELIDAAEARTLEHRVGEQFEGVVLAADERGATVQLARPAVIARVGGSVPAPGTRVILRLVAVDPRARALHLELARL
jgi:exoribonuclease R